MDYTAVRYEDDLKWLEKKFACQVRHLRNWDEEQNTYTQVKDLHGVITFDDNGVMFEADPRHAQLMKGFMGLTEARPVLTPNMK